MNVLGAWLGVIWGATLQSVAPLVWWFFIFVIADFITGIWAGWKESGSITPGKLWYGMTKKALSFAIIILAHGLDVSFWYILHDMPVFQSITLCAYACGEFASVVKNIERMGYGGALPPALRSLFTSLDSRLEHLVDQKLDDVGLRDKSDDDRPQGK